MVEHQYFLTYLLSFLYLHPLDHIQFNPKNYAQTSVNTYNVSPVLCNFQNGFSESDANCRLAPPLPKKRCLQKQLLIVVS